MLKRAGHVEDRAEERTDFSVKDIQKARMLLASRKRGLKKGRTYHIRNRRGSFIIGDVGKDKPNHVIKTVYGPYMTPPGEMLKVARDRDYAKEYSEYHSRPEQRRNRSERNKGRRHLKLRVGDGMEADHKRPLARGGSFSKRNLQALTMRENRVKFTKTAGFMSDMDRLNEDIADTVLTDKESKQYNKKVFRTNKEKALAMAGFVAAPALMFGGGALTMAQAVSPTNTEAKVLQKVKGEGITLGKYAPEGLPRGGLMRSAGQYSNYLGGNPKLMSNPVLMHELGHTQTIANHLDKKGIPIVQAWKTLKSEHAANMWAMANQKGLAKKLRQAAMTVTNTMNYGGSLLMSPTAYAATGLASGAYALHKINERGPKALADIKKQRAKDKARARMKRRSR